jgi:integrase
MSRTTSKPAPTRRARAIVPVAGVTPHKAGGWRVVASAGGRADRRRLTRIYRDESASEFAEHAGAVDLLDELYNELDRQIAGTSSSSLAGMVRRYADDRERLGRAESYVRELRRKADELADSDLGRTPAELVTAGDLDRFYGELTRRGLGKSSVRSWHLAITGALSAGVRWSELAANVAAKATAPKAPAAEGSAPDPELASRYLGIVEQSSPTLGSLLRVGALTGARRGELCALRWSDLDVELGTLSIERSLTSPKGSRWAEGPTKNRRRRSVALSSEAIAELVAHRARRELLCSLAGVELDRGGFIFGRDEWPDGSVPYRPDYVTRRTRELAAAAGLPLELCHPHGLRHYHATQGIAAGADVVAMAAQLGHDPSVLLSTYAHAVDEAKRAAASAVGKTLAR